MQPYVTGTDEDDDLDDIIELLRASSESHSDDDDSWIELKQQIEKRRKDFISDQEKRKVSGLCEVSVAFCLHVDYFILTRIENVRSIRRTWLQWRLSA